MRARRAVAALAAAVITIGTAGCGAQNAAIPTAVASAGDCRTASDAASTGPGAQAVQRGAASTTRTISSIDTSPYYTAPDNPAQQYSYDSSRPTAYSDADISGAPLYTPVTGSGGGPHAPQSSCQQSLSGGRSTTSLTFVPTQCWYQAVTPGLHRPDIDIFLGCDGFSIETGSFGGSTPSRGGGSGIAIGGPPDGDDCHAGDGVFVGGSIETATDETTVADINQLWNGNKLIGWMYLGSNNTRYVIWNYANQTGYNFGIGYSLGNWSFTAGVSTPGGYSGVDKWNGMLPPGTRVKKCYTKGKQLV